MMFSYEFIEKLKSVYPLFMEFHEFASHGEGDKLLDALNSMCDEKISNEDIITSLEGGEEGRRNLYDRARRLKEREDIYFMALDEFERNEEEKEARTTKK